MYLVYLKLDDNSRFELLGTSYMDTGRLRVYWTKERHITLSSERSELRYRVEGVPNPVGC